MTRTLWITATVAAVALLFALGFGTGWLTHRATLTAQMQDVADDIAEDFPSAGPANADSATPAPDGPPQADSPTDGVFTYEVTSVESADSYTNDWDETSHASQTYTIITVDAENTSNGPAKPAADSSIDTVTGYDADGRAYTADWEVWSYMDNDINPGGTATYEVVFDVPEGTELTVLELAASDAPEAAVIPTE